MFGDIGKIMKMAGEMKTKMPEMRAKLEASEYTASAGGGAVTAKVSGKMSLIDIKIDPSLLAPQTDGEMDTEMLEDLVKAAVATAQEQAAIAAKEAMQELTGGIDLPGLGDMI